jgi:thioredoxin 1
MLLTLKKTMASFQELINSGKTVLVDFSAEWCGPCKMMAPILKQTKDALGEKATIIKIDIDKNRQAAEHFQIQGVPTLILFKDGQIKWRQSGVVPANTLIQVINQNGN